MRIILNIGANLTDPMFQGIYGGSKKHEADLDIVLKRCWDIGMQKIIVTCGSVNDIAEAAKVIERDDRLVMTVGCHPTRCSEFLADPDEYLKNLTTSIEKFKQKVVAVGEIGLDYDRLHFCEKDIQKKYFDIQLQLAEEFKLPLFLHCRNSHEDFIEIIEKNRDKIKCGGVVHSFDGNIDEAEKLIDLGFFIGLNGCSLKTEDNLQVVSLLPAEKIMIETDAPWCGIRPSHASAKFVKTKFPTVKRKEKWTADQLIDGRCEPIQIYQVLEVIAGVKGEDEEKLADLFYKNTMSVFFPNELE
ncbi:deoxyribonuclease TATDN1 isoform X3 [Lutzomyia longipalpis]|uniref:deoxyribonuclease TATDN1 isoform X3 n=1 Tax=Lutzomyia longipalpis TaxID=7200 RepID=UPI00248457BF|nr:deoxyribonuclease TATDN1 isoform X3 [Lutzomyia longipalpis]